MTITLKRRKAIVAGLQPWLREEEIAVALETLEEDAAFNLQRFADRIYERLAPRCERRELHRSLVQSVFLGEQAEDAAGAPARGGDLRESRVFAVLLGGFLRLLAAEQGTAEAAVRGYLLEKIEKFGLAAAGQRAVTEWLSGHGTDLAAPVGRDAMRRMVNLSYVLACEYLGPVAADRLLARAVREAEALPEARSFAPRELL